MIPLEDDFVPETGIDCTLTQEAEEAGDVYAPYMPVSMFYIILHFCRRTPLSLNIMEALRKNCRVSLC